MHVWGSGWFTLICKFLVLNKWPYNLVHVLDCSHAYGFYQYWNYAIENVLSLLFFKKKNFSSIVVMGSIIYWKQILASKGAAQVRKVLPLNWFLSTHINNQCNWSEEKCLFKQPLYLFGYLSEIWNMEQEITSKSVNLKILFNSTIPY